MYPMPAGSPYGGLPAGYGLYCDFAAKCRRCCEYLIILHIVKSRNRIYNKKME